MITINQITHEIPNVPVADAPPMSAMRPIQSRRINQPETPSPSASPGTAANHDHLRGAHRKQMAHIDLVAFRYFLLRCMPVSDEKKQLPTLELCWTMIPKGEEASHYVGELLGSVVRLNVIQQALHTMLETLSIEEALSRIVVLIENYLNTVYALRERAVKLLLYTAVENAYDADLLRSKRTREDVVRKLGLPVVVGETFLSLMSTVDPDISLRNRNTHDTFLRLELWTGYDVFDPLDVRVGLAAKEEARAQLDERLGEELARQVDEHCKRIDLIETAVHAFLDALEKSSTLGEI